MTRATKTSANGPISVTCTTVGAATDNNFLVTRRAALVGSMIVAASGLLAPLAGPAAVAQASGTAPELLDPTTISFFRGDHALRTRWDVAQRLVIAQDGPVSALLLSLTIDSRLLEPSDRLVSSSGSGLRVVLPTADSETSATRTFEYRLARLEGISGPIEVSIPLRARSVYPNDLIDDATPPVVTVVIEAMDGSSQAWTMPLVVNETVEQVSAYALQVFGSWWSAATSADGMRVYRAPTSLSLRNQGPDAAPRSQAVLMSDARFSGEPTLSELVASNTGAPALVHDYDGDVRRSTATLPEVPAGVDVDYWVVWPSVVLSGTETNAFASQMLLQTTPDGGVVNRVPAEELVLVDDHPVASLNGVVDIARTELG